MSMCLAAARTGLLAAACELLLREVHTNAFACARRVVAASVDVASSASIKQHSSCAPSLVLDP
jgi:hypothetical protein